MTEKAIVRAMQLLELLADSDEPRGVSELSRELDWTKSAAHRLLNTLSDLGYVRQSEDTQQYQLNYKILQLASKTVKKLDLRRSALPHLRELLRITGETARLSILAGDQAICIEQYESSHPVTIQTQIGGRLPLECSATGKAILAFQGDDLIDRVAKSLVAYNQKTLSSRQKLLNDLALTRKRGFSINSGERHLTVTGVAAAVHDRYGNVGAAIGISGPSERLTDELMRELGPKVKEIADKLSEELGWTADRQHLVMKPLPVPSRSSRLNVKEIRPIKQARARRQVK